MLLWALGMDDASDREFMLDLYERYLALMYDTALKQISDRETAEDIVQDSVVKLIGKIGTLRELHGSVLTAYIVYTVRNTAISFHRKRGVREALAAAVPEELRDMRPGNDPEALFLAAEEQDRFRLAFSRLSAQEQCLLKGKYVLGLNDGELAALLGCRPDSVRMRLTRARRHACDLMKEAEGRDDKN